MLGAVAYKLLYRPAACCEAGGPFAGAKILSEPTPLTSLADALTKLREKHKVNWLAFAEMAGVTMDELQGWMAGIVPSRDAFDDFRSRLTLYSDFSEEDIDGLVKNYYLDALRQKVAEDEAQNSSPVDERYKIRPATPSHVLSSAPTFAAALEQIRATRNLPWSVISTATGVGESTLRTWMRGTIPRSSSLQGFLATGTKSKLFSLGERTLLSESYNYDVERQVLSKGNTDILIDQSLNVDDREGIPFSTNASSVRLPAPPAPKQISPGPTLNPTDAGFEITIQPPPEAERNSVRQISLHRRLQEHVHRLESALPRISNTHAMLVSEFKEYCKYLPADLANLNVPMFWSIGMGIGEHILAIGQAGPQAMTPPLEPDIAAELNGLMRDHAAFIQGFAEGRELSEDVIKTREAAQQNPDMQAQTKAALKPMAETPHLLADKARGLVKSLVSALSATTSATYGLLASSANATRNIIVAFGHFLHPIFITNEAVNMAMLAAHHEHADVLQAVVVYLRDNMELVLTQFVHDPQVATWLTWVSEWLQRIMH